MKGPMKRYFLFFYFLLVTAISTVARPMVDSLLLQLDNTIASRSIYEAAKIKRIDIIKDKLHKPHLSIEQRYQINDLLFHEYESYVCDSARRYVDANIKIASNLGRREWLTGALLKKAHILATSGLYVEAMKLLESIDKEHLEKETLVDYYIAFENLYLYQAEYAKGDEYMQTYLKTMNLYRDSVLAVVPDRSYQYIITKVPALVEQQKLNEAEHLLLSYLPQVSTDTRNYAVLTSILAFVYECSGRTEARKEYLIKSAISDVKAVVKENNSLRALSELLYQEGQIERADHYVKVSMEDANVYNARLRNVQASKMLPIIDKVYQSEKEHQQQVLRWMLGIISILSFFLLLAIVYVIMQMKKLARANEKQRQTNHSLTEANCIKEEYIGRFLSLCSAYIDKLEVYRRMLNKKASSGKTEELFRTLKSTQFVDDELKEFYHSFDISFLNIFPDFVESFNALLPEKEQIHPKQGEKLTTELRIFALIRLGITDSSKIADFLRYSITTIYTYRSKLRNKSLYKDSFEERVMKIASFDNAGSGHQIN